MRTTFGITIMIMLMHICPNQSFAQDHDEKTENRPIQAEGVKLSPEERAVKRTERIATELALTEAQKQKVAELMLSHEQKMQLLIEEHKALREKMKTQRQQLKSEIDAVLTAEQKEKRDQVKAQHLQEKKLKEQRCCKCCGK